MPIALYFALIAMPARLEPAPTEAKCYAYCMVACGQVAGNMPTADLPALMPTNIVTKEFIVHGVVRLWLHLCTHRFMAIVMPIALHFALIAMPARLESAPTEAKLLCLLRSTLCLSPCRRYLSQLRPKRSCYAFCALLCPYRHAGRT